MSRLIKVVVKTLFPTCHLSIILETAMPQFRFKLPTIPLPSWREGFKLFIILGLIFAAGAGSAYLYFQTKAKRAAPGAAAPDKYHAFVGEVYDKILENYWDKIGDDGLTNLFKLAAEKMTATPQKIKTKDKEGLLTMVDLLLKEREETKKKEVVVNLTQLVLGNLSPFGRNGLYTRKEETQLKNLVQNVNPEKNLYENLGVSKEAPPEIIQQQYEKKAAELEKLKESSPEAKKKLEEVRYAYQVLSDQEKKTRYDTVGAEPTVFAKAIRPAILHLYIKRFSPTTLEEFQKALNNVDSTPELNTLILDLRGNIGGAIDLIPYFLGPFIGQNQYAYEFLHQSEYTPYKTQIGWLPALIRYKKVIVLIDGQSQSTAELTASVLKRYNVGVLVGEKTKGWGTIEKVFELKNQIDPAEKYSVFLVHTLTLREDNQPLEGRGVEPVIKISDPNWEKQLLEYFNYPELNAAVKELWQKGLAEFN